MRRSKSSLSEKSLEICTESLGSETGSDGFSSYPPSEAGDVEHDDKESEQQAEKQHHHQQQQLSESSHGKKMGPRSFPPPLPSLAREDGASVHMQSHRQNGRLVLEAVSVPSQNYFQAHREHGRLRLSFVNDPAAAAQDEVLVVEDFQRMFDNFEEIEGENDDVSIFDGDDEEEEEEEEDEDWKFEMKMDEINPYPTNLTGGGGLMQHVHNSQPTTIMVKKLLLGLDKKNLAWSSRFNKSVNLLEVDDDDDDYDEEEEGVVVVNDPNINNPPPLPQSLPPPPRVARLISNPPPSSAAAASFNAYEYFWREKKPTMATILKPHHQYHRRHHQDSHQYPPPDRLNNTHHHQNNKQVIRTSNLKKKKGFEQQNLVVMRGGGGGNKAEYLVPVLRRCNESRRSLLLWEPYCIAT